MNRVGILGYGEVGSSIEKLYLGKDFDVRVKDPGLDKVSSFENIDVLNICIPYNDAFIATVVDEIYNHQPLLTIIHSTVSPGTVEHIQRVVGIKNVFVVHSPVRGNHPDLYHSLKTFVKYIGADVTKGRELAEKHFESLGIPYKCIGSSRTTEVAKLLCTTYYGLCIAWHEEMFQLCKQHNISFDRAVTDWNTSYNEGYTEMGMKSVIRPVLYPPQGKIGGHCVIPNAKILKEHFNSPIIDFILNLE